MDISVDLSLLVSTFALLASVSANVIAERGRRSAVAAEQANGALAKAQKRTELLLELEIQRSKYKTMQIVLRTKLSVFEGSYRLAAANNREIARLRDNLKLIDEHLAGHEEQVSLAERADANLTMITIEHSLADVRRLNIAIAEDLRNEEIGLEDARKAASERAAFEGGA